MPVPASLTTTPHRDFDLHVVSGTPPTVEFHSETHEFVAEVGRMDSWGGSSLASTPAGTTPMADLGQPVCNDDGFRVELSDEVSAEARASVPEDLHAAVRAVANECDDLW